MEPDLGLRKVGPDHSGDTPVGHSTDARGPRPASQAGLGGDGHRLAQGAGDGLGRRFLPEGVHFVGGNPIIAVPLGVDQATASARADLFRDGLFCLTPAPNADEEAVQLAMNLVGRLGAKPLFIDPAEHDGLLAAVEHLPHLLALTLLDMAIDQPTWRELRKVAGAPFDASTYSGRGDPAAHAALATANRENLVRWIDAFSASLAAVRQALVDGDEGALAARFGPAILEREQWLQSRAQGTWDEPERVNMPERMGFMDLMLGGLMPGRKKRDD